MLLMAALVWKIDVGEIVRAFRGVGIGLFALASAVFLVQQVLVAYSWQLLLKAQQSRVPFARVLQVHFIGTFFGIFMPTSVGMDVVRAFALSKHLKNGVDAVTSMFVSRVVGYLVFFAMALLVAVPVARMTHNQLLFWVVLAMAAVFVAAVWLVLHPRFLRPVAYLFGKIKLQRLVPKLEAFQNGIAALRRKRGLMLQVLLLSVAYQAVGILVIYLTGLSLQIAVGIQYYFIYVPLIMAITILPLSIAGIGVREGAFVFFFTPLGASEAQALTLSLLLFVQMLGLAVVGGLAYWVSGLARVRQIPPGAADEKSEVAIAPAPVAGEQKP